MEQYIGTKIIQAEPAKRFWMPDGNKTIVSLNEIVDRQIVNEAVSCDEGYKVRYSDGYDSFSPKEVFEEAYRRTDNMNFGLALEAAKKGLRIARSGWNGNGMYVFLADIQELNTQADLSEFEDQDVEISDLLVLRTAQGTLQPGWLATQSDMLADDWYIVE